LSAVSAVVVVVVSVVVAVALSITFYRDLLFCFVCFLVDLVFARLKEKGLFFFLTSLVLANVGNEPWKHGEVV